MPELTATTPDETTAVISAEVALPVDAAWQAFIDADTLARWFWPERLRSNYEVDARDLHRQGWTDCLTRLAVLQPN